MVVLWEQRLDDYDLLTPRHDRALYLKKRACATSLTSGVNSDANEPSQLELRAQLDVSRAFQNTRGSAEISRGGTPEPARETTLERRRMPRAGETTAPEVDEHDSGTEGDTESDGEEGSSPKRRKKKAGRL
ncbi:hypothetical protein FN846DRAFT_1022604 [Sphaerosporella brunnea]|uniref:Uncharacterized protein n=1 Tax=Sphaerosporella brunnea TaxID=1250544 RepID=A0A5J5ESX2_9PEZI|nr:hypothetical protein FN846DRAFT_1022604 [Sphaerosporella brunnea]